MTVNVTIYECHAPKVKSWVELVLYQNIGVTKSIIYVKILYLNQKQHWIGTAPLYCVPHYIIICIVSQGRPYPWEGRVFKILVVLANSQ